MRISLICCLMVLAIAPAALALGQPQFQLTPLTLPSSDGQPGVAISTNDPGQTTFLAGPSFGVMTGEGVRWLGFWGSGRRGILPTTPLSNSGVVAGRSSLDDFGLLTSDVNRRLHSLPNPLGDDTFIDPVDINDRGEVLAAIQYTSASSADRYRAALWAHRRVRLLPTFGNRSTKPIAINNRGQVLMNFDYGAVRVADRTPTSIVSPDPQYHVVEADAMNNDGVVVGIADGPNGRTYGGFVWTDSSFTLIPKLLAKSQNFPRFIDDAGEVVGIEAPRGGASTTFFYADGVTYDLSQLISDAAGWTDIGIIDMTAGGRMLGHGKLNGTERDFVLERIPATTPVPEASCVAIAVAAALVATRRHERKAKPRGRRDRGA